MVRLEVLRQTLKFVQSKRLEVQRLEHFVRQIRDDSQDNAGPKALVS